MTRLIVDAATREKRCANGDLSEVCDETGTTLGNFYQAPPPGKFHSPFPDAEI
jgi:hypothetical protein